MAGKKGASVAELLEALRDKGVRVIVETVEVPVVPVQKKRVLPSGKTEERVNSRIKNILLRCRHSLGNSVYGPGKVTVDNELASILLYHEQQAVAYDERLMSKKERSYLIVVREGKAGRVHVGIPVSPNVMDGDMSGITTNMFAF